VILMIVGECVLEDVVGSDVELALLMTMEGDSCVGRSILLYSQVSTKRRSSNSGVAPV